MGSSTVFKNARALCNRPNNNAAHQTKIKQSCASLRDLMCVYLLVVINSLRFNK